jgi:uridine kinase
MITDHCEKYPGLTLQDLFKFLYQSAFGCEHLLGHRGDVVEYLEAEYKSGGKRSKNEVEPLDGDYSRVHLGVMRDGLSKETFGTLFFLSAKHEKNAAASLREKLEITWEMILEGALPFSEIEFNAAAKIWRKRGFPPLHHSEKFRSLYRPAYRLISNKFVPFLPLFTAIDKALAAGEVTLAIEGGAASGKSTLAELLCRVYGCTVIHVDDYFLRPEQRTPERLSEIGGNFDRERFIDEVAHPLSRGEDMYVRKSNCGTMTLGEPTEVKRTRLTVVEGVYSMHPELEQIYNLSVFLDVPADVQTERIANRNSPEMARRFFEEWIPKENAYFDKMNVKNRCTLVLKI